ncbi:MAG: FtsQ-type POTRA domain-containing protein [Clostridia bacterium]|nr:FtsQ-type POTRA domain-containing protein [Clostridia bacterium]
MIGKRVDGDFYSGAVGRSFHGNKEDRTQMYRGKVYNFDEEKDNGNDASPEEEKPSRISARGKEKLSEARREAGERRKFIKRKRGLVLFLIILVLFVMMMLAVYKLVFVVKNIEITGNGKYSVEELLEASGIGEGVNLYSFRASSVENNITLNCPYIKSVEVDRTMPGDVKITVVEDKAVFYVDVFGEYKILSDNLRVLETLNDTEEVPKGLIKLKLPQIKYAVTGRVITFAGEKRDRDIRDILQNMMNSPLAERVTLVDVRDQFDITMVVDGKFKLVFGDDENVLYKLKTASKVLEDDMFKTDNKVKIDLTTDGKTGVIIDNLMELE